MVDLAIPEEFKRKKEKRELDIPDEFKIPELLDEDEVYLPSDDPSIAKMAGALTTEILIAEGGRTAGAAFGPIGYIVGALGAGAAGSIAAQKITNPNDISEGRVIADALINLVPGLKAAKGKSVLNNVLTRQAPMGAGFAITGISGETLYDEGRLPTIDELALAGMTGGVLGGALGFTGAGVNSLLTKYGGSSTEEITKLIREGADPNLIKFYKNLKNRSKESITENEKWAQDALLQTRRALTDANIIQRQLQKESGQGQYINKDGVLELKPYYVDKQGRVREGFKEPGDRIITRDDQDYYQTKRLAEGSIDGQLEVLINEDKIVSDLLTQKAIKLSKPGNTITPKNLSDNIDQYLHAKYAIDYNKFKGKDGAAGIKTSQAKEIVRQFEEMGLDKELAIPIKTLKEQINRTNELAVEGGLISREQLNIWKKDYGDNYVPLHRMVDDTDLQIKSPDGPSQVKWRGIYDEYGSELPVKSIKENVYRQLADIARRANLNKANLAFVKLINAPGNKEAAEGIINKVKGRNYGVLESKYEKPPSEASLTYLDNGERRYLEFADAGVAEAFRGTPQQEMGAITKAVYTFSAGMNRRLGALYTRFNPDFVIPNLFRDRTEASINNVVRLNAKQGAATLNPMKAVWDDMRIIKRKHQNLPAETTKDKELYRLYDEFKADGGSVGGLAATTQEELIDKVNKLSDNLSSTSPVKLGRNFIDWFDKVNNVFEDSTRFATYKLAREAGKSRQAAALAARDSSFDPRLGGTNVNAVRAAYLFANPAIQASKVFLKNIFRNPKKVGMPFLATLMGIKMGLDKWNSSIDPDWEEKLKTTTGSNHVKNKSLVVLTGVKDDGSPSYITMPIGYSMVPFAVAADYAQKAARGKETTETYAQQAGNVVSELSDAYIPVGRGAIPTPLTPIFDLMQNKDGLGRTIRPEWLESKNMAAKEKMFPFTMDTYGGELAYGMAEQLEKFGFERSPEDLKYLFDKFTGGPGKTLNNLGKITVDLMNGKELKKSEIPVARRFFGDGYEEKFEQRAGIKSEVEEFARIDNTERAREGRITSQIFRQIKDARDNNKPEDANKVLMDALEKGNLTPAVIQRLERRIKDDKKGLTSLDRRVKQLSISRRGQYILNQLKGKTPKEISAYLQEQVIKGILTKNVMNDVSFIKGLQKMRERLK